MTATSPRRTDPRGMVRRAAFGMWMLGGCAEDVEVAALGELCGVAGPVRMLELPPGEVLAAAPLSVGDRVYYTVGRPRPGDQSSSPTAQLEGLRVWSTGPCGESPVQVATGVTRPFEIDRWPGVLLACDELTNDVLSLDPTGEAPPNLVFTGGCSQRSFTEHGYISFDHDNLTLVRQAYPDDPRSETAEATPFGPALTTGGRVYEQSAPQVRADEAFVITQFDELVRIDLATGETTVEQTEVHYYVLSDDARYLLWQRYEGGFLGDSSTPEPVLLVDRDSGVGTALGRASLFVNGGALGLADRGYFLFLVEDRQQVFTLPDLRVIEVPRNYRVDPRGPIDDRRWVTYPLRTAPIYLYDFVERVGELFFARPVLVLERDPEGLVLVDFPCCAYNTPIDEQGPVRFVPYDGEPTVLAERATRFAHRPDPGRLVTLVDIDDDRLGALVLVDTHTRAERRIDDHVFAAPRRAGEPADRLSYSVVDGARSGVWQVELPAAP